MPPRASCRVIFFNPMSPTEPAIKKTFAYFDGQNLFKAAREAFGYTYPNYDIPKLAEAICSQRGWQLDRVHFYTGIPEQSDHPGWNHFWRGKLAVMGRQGVRVFSRHLRYRNKTVRLPNGTTHTFLVGEEKGIDIRLALDVVRAVRRAECAVVVIFSQDQDLSEVADEIRLMAQEQGHWVKIASAFPFSPTSGNRRGINKTDWIPIDRSSYDACLDSRDYRPRP